MASIRPIHNEDSGNVVDVHGVEDDGEVGARHEVVFREEVFHEEVFLHLEVYFPEVCSLEV